MNSNKFDNIERFADLYFGSTAEETIDVIEWDYLENAYIDNLGNIYKADIPEHLQKYVQEKKPIGKLKLKIKRQTR